jgi:hypothetical protein
MSVFVFHLTVAVVYKVYNLLVSIKGKKHINVILSIVLCRGYPYTVNITEKCALVLSDEEKPRMICYSIKTK